MTNDSAIVAVVSALPCPHGCSLSPGRETIVLTTSVMSAIATSVSESMPSPITARLPETFERKIFTHASARFPKSAIYPARRMSAVCLSSLSAICNSIAHDFNKLRAVLQGTAHCMYRAL